MSNEVQLTGKAELDAIYQALKKIQDHANTAMTDVGNLGKRTEENLEKTTKKTETNIKKTGTVLRRLASQLFSDFKGLLALQSVLGGLKLSNQFAGSVKESIKLSDTVRRLGNSFSIAKKDFGFFQAYMARGLGDIGASSEAASNALEGLAGFGVKGIESATNLTKGAVTLAGIGGEKGNEKGVAAGLATAMQEQGKDVNDVKAQKDLIGEVSAAVTTTGKSATEILGAMNEIFSTMPEELRKTIGPQAMAQMATVAATVGPQATKALQEYMSKTTEQRMAMEAQGFNVFKGGKLDMKSLQSFIAATKDRGISPRASLQTAGFSEEAAEGLVRLAEKADLVNENLDKLAGASRDNEAAFKESMGMLDAFKGTINTVKGYLEEAFSGVGQKVTDTLGGAVGSPAKSAAVVAGGAVLASVLAGQGLKGLFKFGANTLKGDLTGKAEEAITGEKVTPVRVTNFEDMHSGAEEAAGAAGAGGLGTLGKVGAVAGAGAVGAAIGAYVVNPLLDKYTQGTNDNGYEGNAVERFFSKLDEWSGGGLSGTQANVKVKVETKEPNLRTRTEPGRGSSN